MTFFKNWSFESRLILVVALVQFVNILDFMMVMPLGPDFARALSIPTHNIGFIGGIYTLAASITGLIAALFLDKFDRKSALLFSLVGLVVATASASLAWDLYSMLAARILAGIFGGPVTSLAIAMIADHIPPQRRGAAMGKVMGSFAAASVLGVPFGLEIARHFGWYAPFLALSGLGLIVIWLGYLFLPAKGNVTKHLSMKESVKSLLRCLENRTALLSFAIMGLSMMSGFMIIPNISAHLQLNMGYARDSLGLLYFCGGFVSFFGMRYVGKMMDKVGTARISIMATALFAVAILTGFIFYEHTRMLVLPTFVLFMVAMTSRSVAGQTLSSKVPKPSERGEYMSLQSSVTHMASALGAFLSAQLLYEAPDGTLAGVPTIGAISLAISLVVPFLFIKIEKSIVKHEH